MSKPTEFWNSFGWALIWLGFLGGLALVIWSANRFGNQDKKLCIQEHGTWAARSDNGYRYYTCEFGK